jgi:hypothetical protein
MLWEFIWKSQRLHDFSPAQIARITMSNVASWIVALAM